MTDEEMKKKIVEIIINAIWKDAEADYDSTDETEAGSIAEALIAAGIGDVNKFADTLASKIPCHSYYYGDSIVSAIYVLKEGREIKDVKPVNISEFLVDELRRKLKEAEHRAEVAERALQKFAENITCEDCPFSSDCASPEKMEDLIHSNYCFAEYLKQAEKELTEEEKEKC